MVSGRGRSKAEIISDNKKKVRLGVDDQDTTSSVSYNILMLQGGQSWNKDKLGLPKTLFSC